MPDRHAGQPQHRRVRPARAWSARLIESLAENLTYGVLSPLWALCLFGLPGLILVRAVFQPRFHGRLLELSLRPLRLSQRQSDDLVHWLPARLSVPP